MEIGELLVPLIRDKYLGHLAERRVCLFSMRNGDKAVRFAATFELLDDMEGAAGLKHFERSGQFERLRDRLEQVAQRKFELLSPAARPLELLLTSADLKRLR
jgi:hypothetical protein